MVHKEKYQELVNAGLQVEPYPPDAIMNNGFLVNGKFIIGAIKKRWRVKGRAKWYWYKDMEQLKSFIKEG